MNEQIDVNQIHFMFHFKWHISASADRMLNKETPARDKFACLFRNTGKILTRSYGPSLSMRKEKQSASSRVLGAFAVKIKKPTVSTGFPKQSGFVLVMVK